jgi:signal transduction histidine kinase
MELSRIVPAADGDNAERLARARAIAGDVLETIRNVSLMLRPTILDDLGLKAALEWHVQDFSKRTKIPCTLECSLDDEDRLAESIRICIYRIVQEALNNCEKHASATRILVGVKEEAGEIVATIWDNGRGIAPERAREGGLGIPGMKERAALAAGTLEIETSEEKGTKVILRVPAIQTGAEGNPPGL